MRTKPYVRFLSSVHALNLLLAGCGPLSATAQNPLPVPDTLSGADIQLTVQDGSWEFHPGETVATYGVNGNLLAPTLLLDQGQQVTLNVTNTLPDLTTMHWHGLHVSAMNDGGPHSLIYPGTTWSPSFTVLDRASTFWYHPHSHGLTDYQVSMGLAGMIIVRDPLEAALALPRTYGVDDIPLIIQSKAIVDGQIMLHTGLDSVITVNGVCRAVAQVPAQVVRLRCVNGASERTFLLGFDNGMSFHVIGTDGGLLSAPVELSRIQLMPGERLELLLDLTGHEAEVFHLMAYNSDLPNGILGAAQVGMGAVFLDGYEQNALNGADFPILSLQVNGPTTDPVMSIPSTLVPTQPFSEADATRARNFNLQPESPGPLEMIEGPFMINGEVFDMDVINEVVELGTTEIWSFQNNTQIGHPMHIHDIQFNILDRNGAAPEPWESGWKDVVYVPPMGSARVITRFDDFADPEMPYMYHCHMLMHEDEGLMGQFLVVDGVGIDAAPGASLDLRLSPNPSTGETLRLVLPGYEGAATMELIDAMGRSSMSTVVSFRNGSASVPVASLSPGTYALVLRSARDQSTFTTRLVLQP